MKTSWKIVAAVGLLIIFVVTTMFIIRDKEELVSSENGANTPSVAISKEQLTENVTAFAKLYGYIRYFHPSDEASELDWDQYAHYGIGQVKQATNTEELMQILERIFKPIAPTIRLTTGNNQGDSDLEQLYTNEQYNDFIFWQHQGVQTNLTNQFYGMNNPVYESKRVVFSKHDGQVVFEEALFEQSLEEEQYVVQKEIAEGITAVIPMVLPYDSTAGRTYSPDETEESLKTLQQEMKELRWRGYDSDEDARMAGVVITWNIFQHFYPYWDEVEREWQEVLPLFIEKVQDDETYDEYVASLMELVAEAQDGHAVILKHITNKEYSLPFRVRLIDNQVVIIEALEDSLYRVGDIILTKDGGDAIEIMEELWKIAPGSPQYKEHFAEFRFVRGKYNEKVTFEILRDGRKIEIPDTYTLDRDIGSDMPLHRSEPIVELKDGIYYIALHEEITKEELEDYAERLAFAKGLIFDGRYYPASVLDYFPHLIDEPATSSQFLLPQFMLPDQEAVGYEDGSWQVSPENPRFSGEIVFLADSSTISWGETLLGLVENNHLGTIIGKPTAGTNGNINLFGLEEDIYIYFTGMKVVKADGSQHHLIGIEPDIDVDYTNEAVQNGKDDFIEKALEVIENEKIANH